MDLLGGRKKSSQVVIPIQRQSCVGDIVSLEVVPGGEPSEGFGELKLALRTPSEILQPRVEL